MVAFPGGPRAGYNKKLVGVLDHQLRVGDEQVSDAIIAAYRERGLQAPEHIETPPSILPEYIAYWEAYRDLISERVTPRGPLPALKIIQYAIAYGLNPDALKRIVWAVDKVLTDHWKGQDAAAEAKRKDESKRKSLPGGQP